METIEKQTEDDIAGEQHAWYRHLPQSAWGLPERVALRQGK